MGPPRLSKSFFILVILLVIAGGFFVFQNQALAAAGINEQINFQGKLVNTDGTNIPNGTYNMEFKIYQDGDGVPGGGDETLKWTEDRLRNNSQGVVVADGIFQVNLGSVTALSGIDWNQSVLWVSISVGNTNATCTPFSNCVSDGEMNPMVRFTAAPYALNADKVSGLTVTDTTGTLTIPNSKTVQFADAFTTSGAFATTLTVTNTTNATLPAGTVTLAALGTAQTWTANQTFANATGTDDTLGFAITTGGAGRFAGTLTNADLTGNHSWILPNLDGTIALSANKLSVFAATTSAELSGVLSDENTSGGYMTDVMTTAGDLIYAGASGVPARLAGSGTNGWVLTYNTGSNAPEWAAGGGGHTQNTDTGTDGTTFTIGDGSTTFTVNTSATNDAINIEQGTFDSILSFTQPGAANQTYVFATGGNVCTDGAVCSGYSASHTHPYLSDSSSSTQTGYFGDIYMYDDSTPSNYLQITNSGNLTAPHILSLNTNNVDRIVSLSGDLTTANSLTTSGNFGLTLTTTNTTNATLPAGTVTLMANPMTTIGDIIYGGTGGLPTRLAGSGTNGWVLTYNTGSNAPYWAAGGGAGPWTDGTGITYLTDTAEDLAVGANSLVAPFSVDIDLQTVRIGKGSTANGILNMYASDGDTGSITYTTNDSWDFEGGNVGIGTASPANLLTVGAYDSGTSSTFKQGLLSTDNMLLAQLGGGAYFGRTGIKENQWALEESSFWASSTQRASSNFWSGLAMSSAGRIQTAVVNGGGIWVSSDYGVTWTQKDATTRIYYGVAMSSDGKIQTAVVNGSSFGQGIYVSTDYGTTWTQKDPNIRNYVSVAMSSDGKIQAATVWGGFIYVSTDYGTTWTQKDPTTRNYRSLAMSSDGKIQTAVINGSTNGQGIYVSTDYGTTWTQKDSTIRGYLSVAMSSDGKIQTAVVYDTSAGGQGIYVSTDYGATWTQKDSTTRGYFGVAMSSDGKIQTAVITGSTNGQGVYVSTDYGTTWTQKDSNIRNYNGFAMSSDGKYQAAVVASGYIYTSVVNSVMSGGLTIGAYDSGTSSTFKQGLLSTDNVLLSQLEGGSYFGRVGVRESQWGIADYGATWTQKNSAVRDYYGVAMSSDGKYQTAVIFSNTNGQGIYVSTDYGTTWTQKDSANRNYYNVAMSSDGKIQTAVEFNGYIYVSTDYGTTWTQKDSNYRFYVSIAMSSDGKIQTAVEFSGYIYVSTDYGTTWTQKDSNYRSYGTVAMSSDGKIQTAVVKGSTNGQGIYVSTDYGTTWTQKDSTIRDYLGVAMSSDGKIQTAVVYDTSAGGQGIYVSTNYGTTWTQKDPTTRNYRSLAMSSDGKIQTAVINGSTNGQGIYVSTNYGTTWTQKDSTIRNYSSVAMSSDGKIQTTVVTTGGIYVSHASVNTLGNVGIGTTSTNDNMLQVGSNTNYGDATVYGDIIKKGIISQKAISGTINDVFIYDTTRDSDAGRWTNSKTAQGLSWYTETKDHTAATCDVGSDDRCGQSAFPEKAVIVATNDAVYIFDADTNMMWMKFTQAGTYALGADSANNPSSVFALNGVVYVGTNGASSTGLYAIDFTQDRMYRYNTTDRNQGDKKILDRNSTVNYNVQSVAAVKFIGAASVQVNDVHGAVVSGSSSLLTNGGPLNGGTFICAATDDGVQVINLTSGITIPFGDANITDQYSACFVTRRARMYALNVTKQELNRFGNPATSNNNIDTAVIAPATGITTPYKIWDESTTAANAPNLFKTAQTINVKPDTLEVIERASAVDEKGDLIYVGHGGGLTEIHDLDTNASPTLGWSKFYSITGETGLMSGTPRGMFGFGEAAGATQAVDATVRANVLAIKSGVTMGVNGVHGTAANFNGTSGYMCSDTDANGACDQDTDFDPTSSTISYSFEMWFRHNGAVSGTDTLVDRSGSSTVAGFIVTMNSSGQVIATERDGTITDTLTSTQSFADSQWHHMEVTRDSGSAKFCLFIDGRLAVACDTATTTVTLNGLTAMAIGASCTGTVTTCSTQANFWDGDIDDVYFDMGGATTADQLTQAQVRKKYLEGRAALARPSATFVDATTASSTTIGDSTAAWVPNSFVGEIVEITQGTGVGQTRRIVSNTSTVLTVNRAFTTVPDTTSDFEVMPEQLYGATNSVYAIGVVDNTYLGETRKLYVGTNDGADGGGVTVFEGMGTASATEVYHSGADKIDDSGTDPTWTGSNYDNIQSIGSNGTSVAFGSTAALWTESDTVDLQSVVDKFANNINSIRAEMVVDGITGTSSEIGGVGGADLAEYYTSSDGLSAGDIVSVSSNSSSSINKSATTYQKDILGVVATSPGMILGTQEENSYPVALVGRVPVNVSTENGLIQTGDQITSGSLPGYGMLAIEAGRVIGTALEDMKPENLGVCPGDENLNSAPERKCGQVMVFINLSEYLGIPISELAQNYYDKVEQENKLNDLVDEIQNSEESLIQGQKQGQAFSGFEKEEKILGYLEKIRKEQEESGLNSSSEIFTGKLIAKEKIISPEIFAESIFAKSIKADKIEGLEFVQIGLNKAQYEAQENSNDLRNLGDELAALQNKMSELTDSRDKGLSINTFQELVADGWIVIVQKAEFKNETVFQKVARFFGKVIFGEDVEFAGRAIFNQDAAGYAVIKEGDDKVEINFEKEYEEAPVVNATISIEKIEDEELRKATEEYVLISDLKFVVTSVTPKGFEIKINQKAGLDTYFNWQAVAVKNPQIFGEKKDEKDKENKAESTPTITTETEKTAQDSNLTENPILQEEVAPEPAVASENQVISAATDTIVEPAD